MQSIKHFIVLIFFFCLGVQIFGCPRLMTKEVRQHKVIVVTDWGY